MHERCPICQSPLKAGQPACEMCGFKLSGATQGFSPVEAPSASLAPTHADPLLTPVMRMVRGPQRGAEYKVSPDVTSIGRRDEQSYNGVWVNNVSVDQKVLEQDDFVQIGRFGFIFDTGR